MNTIKLLKLGISKIVTIIALKKPFGFTMPYFTENVLVLEMDQKISFIE